MTLFPNQLLWFLIARALRIVLSFTGLALTLFGLWFIITQIAGKPGDDASLLIIIAMISVVGIIVFVILFQILLIYLFIKYPYAAWILNLIITTLGLLWGFFGLPLLILLSFGGEALFLLLAWPITVLLRISELCGLCNYRVRGWIAAVHTTK